MSESAEDKHRTFERSQIEQTIVDRFLEQVRRFPERPAVATPQHRWSYAELARRVDAMASSILAALGDGPGQIGLLFHHDAPMVAGILAALRAGKAYVPLDPSYPLHRLHQVLEDATPQAILVEASCRALAEGLAPQVSLVDADALPTTAVSAFPRRTPHDLAYILYTSGSTGRPKGVMQSHRNVLHFIRAYTNNLALAPSDRLSLLASYAFDAAVMDLYGALLNGACLVPRSVRDGGFAAIAPWLEHEAITVYHSTPTVYRHVLATADPQARFAAVRRVVLGGEPVVRRDVELFKRAFAPGAVMVNGLGPTESTVTLEAFITHDTVLEGNLVPVGLPVCDTVVKLIDDAGHPAEREGELVFVSEHVALGYWQRPELTSKAFGVDPDDPHLRFYRSGDVGRRRPDGTFEFLGRKDLQAKVHGVRIELEEIEGEVEKHPGVEQCIVVVRPLGESDHRIVACVRPAARGFDLDAVREGVRAELPAAMVPSAFVVLSEMPMTPTGKVDRKALMEAVDALEHPVGVAAPATGASWSPTTDAERRLVPIWTRLLGEAPLRADQDFFAAGGDSLLAVELCDEVEKAFSLRIALGRVFQLRTLQGIAHALQTQSGLESDAGTVIPLTRHGAGGAHLFCICGVQLYQPLAVAIGAPHDVSGVFLPVEEKLLRGHQAPSLTEMAAMYLEVVQLAQPHGPYRLAGVSFGGMLAFEMARQLRAAGEHVASWVSSTRRCRRPSRDGDGSACTRCSQ